MEANEPAVQSIQPSTRAENSETSRATSATSQQRIPTLSLPKGGGAIRGIGEKFAANPVTGTSSMSVPISTSPGRSGFGPQLSLSYDSGAGNSLFGFGWSLSIPAITRKTDKGLPLYRDAEESDVFMLSGVEDLVPVLNPDGSRFEDRTTAPGFTVHRYRPRIEGLFARIERWTKSTTGECHWRSITRDNITTLYGQDNSSRIFDPDDPDQAHPTRIFSWLIRSSFDDKGNATVYDYTEENSDNVNYANANERNRTFSANRHLKRVKYGNRAPNRDMASWRPMDATQLPNDTWMFEVVFDYGEGHYAEDAPDAEGRVYVQASSELAAGPRWSARQDPFSTYRSGFEVRTYRLCKRVLMFHHIPDLPTGEPGCDGLVRSTDFIYSQPQDPTSVQHPVYSFLLAVTHSGYKQENGGLLKRSLPPLEFSYSEPVVQSTVESVDSDSLQNLPAGLDGRNYQWTDLHGEGIPGILTEQGGAWFYKRNLSPINEQDINGRRHIAAKFAPAELVAVKPILTLASSAQFMDLAGDGQPDLVVFGGPTPGFYEHDDDESWQPFRSFSSHLKRDLSDTNVRIIDLDGDGHADVLISEDDAFVWHPSLAEDGFGPARSVRKALDEEKGPRLVFSDSTQSIYLADLSGDGLTDLVRIRNGEISYWPNLGYGRFGAKVTMDNAPHFDNPDQFDQRLVRLSDIDGTGTTDIIYLHRRGVRLYFNQSGNSWSQAQILPVFCRVDDLVNITPADLLGDGTTCLVWSSGLPGDTRHPMRYVNLMGAQKPYLLVKVFNNLGAETRVQYATSTKFYLQDKLAGRPWLTHLPFPVHVVERIETYDHLSRNRFITRYIYHHGYFDGEEREFRGFGMVEQLDTEEYAALTTTGQLPIPTNEDEASHIPPVHTRTWYHTGLYLGRERISTYFAGLDDADDLDEYYMEPGITPVQARALLLEDTVLPTGLTVEEEREACRALKGSMLRQEVYGRDGSIEQAHPYVVIEQNFTVQPVQPRLKNRHAVFYTHPREAIRYHYERRPADPRISHALTLDVDPYGNVRKQAAVAYGRRIGQSPLTGSDRAKQETALITFTENSFTLPIDDPALYPHDYRSPLTYESKTYEITGLVLPAGQVRFGFNDLLNAGIGAASLRYEQAVTVGTVQKRLIEHVRTLYRRTDLTGPLPIGEQGQLALPFESYKLAFTPGMTTAATSPFAGRVTGPMMDEGGYVHSQGDTNWWIPSGLLFFSPGTGDTPGQELVYARTHFFLPHRYRDPFHTATANTETLISYDTYNLLVEETCDPLGNRTTAGERDPNPMLPLVRRSHDYRVLQPSLLMDPNRNRAAVLFDGLGMVAASAVMGKPEDVPVPGDLLDGTVSADPTQTAIDQFFTNPAGAAAAMLLGNATSRSVYDLDRFQRSRTANPNNRERWLPAFAAALSRETHVSDPAPPDDLKIQIVFTYSDGFGREIQRKVPAEAGPVPQRDAVGGIVLGTDSLPIMTSTDAAPRWVGSGWTVFNNKGKPVRRYEPFFTNTHGYEFDVRIGVSPVLCYDPIERVVVTLYPNHTWEKTVFDAWQQVTWDASDTVLVLDPKTDPDAGDFFRRLPSTNYLPTWYSQRQGNALGTHEGTAAQQAAIHANTPSIVHADVLGRAIVTVSHNKVKYGDSAPGDPPLEQFHTSRVEIDIEGNQRAVIDPLGRIVMQYDYDMLGSRIHQRSMEAGERWILNDITGKPMRFWDVMGRAFHSKYDRLRRLSRTYVTGADPIRPTSILLTERVVYGEQHPQGEQYNLRGKPYLHLDQAGVASNESFDFKGNLRRANRRLARIYSQALDWSAVDAVIPTDGATALNAVMLEAVLVPVLETPVFTSSTSYDALNRPVQVIAPHSTQANANINVIQSRYNMTNLLERVDAWLNGAIEPAGLLDPATATQPMVTDIDYDAKGQRRSIDYGNGTKTEYTYHPLTFRLRRLLTTRPEDGFPDDCPAPPPSGWPGCRVQDLSYTYDPVGNITFIKDSAQQSIFFSNQRVEPSAEYIYDALYRLVQATGREHLGQVGGASIPHSYNDYERKGQIGPGPGTGFHPNNGSAMGRYCETYHYDLAGNISEIRHRRSCSDIPSWTRSFAYNETSQIEDGSPGNLLRQNNRLTSTTVGATTETYSTAGNGYDAHGNMLRMPHLPAMQWNFLGQLQMTSRQAVNPADTEGIERNGERTWYVYDSAGQRIRKVTELPTGQIKDERIYLQGFEIYRRSGQSPLTRETVHIMDDKQCIALVETRTYGGEPGVPQVFVRFQLNSQLGSATLELDRQAQIVSYQEYTPYGSTAYQAVRSKVHAPKRYQFTGKERDEESGLYYHGARYYAPWLGRWTACDPAVFQVSGFEHATFQSYTYVENKPTVANDPDGEAINFIAAAVGAVVGAVVGGAIEAGRQYVTTGQVSDWGAVGASAAGGAVSGVAAGLTMGASLAVQATASAAAGVAGGATTRALTGREQTAGAVLQDAVVGLVTFGIVRGGSAAISALRGGTSAATNSGARAVAGTGSRAATNSAARNTAGATAETATTSATARATTGSTARATTGTSARVTATSGSARAATGSSVRSTTSTAAADAVEAARPPAPAAPGSGATASSGSNAVAETATSARPQAPASPQVTSPAPAPSGNPSAPLFEIREGVRRSVAARTLGQPDVLAEVMGAGQGPVRVPLSQLLSPKAALERDPRFLNVLEGVANGRVPPIEIRPLPAGAGEGLTPVLQVRLLRFRGL